MENTTFLHPKKGCHLNFQEENDIVIYLVSFLGSLAVLPGNIISALFMDKIGRIRIIGQLLVSSHLSAKCDSSVCFNAVVTLFNREPNHTTVIFDQANAIMRIL